MLTDQFVFRALVDPVFMQEAHTHAEHGGFSEMHRNLVTLAKDFFTKYSRCPNRSELLATVADLPATEREKFGPEYKRTVNALWTHEAEVTPIDTQVVLDRFSEVVKKKRIGDLITQTAQGFTDNTSEWALQRLERGLFTEGLVSDKRICVDIADVVANTKFALYRDVDRISTSIEALDSMLYGGPGVNELLCFVAPSGRGKTYLLTNLMHGYMQGGKNVLFITLETQVRDIVRRVYRRIVMADKDYFAKPGNMPTVAKWVTKFVGISGSRGMVLYKPANTFSVDDLRAELLRFKLSDNFEPDVIIIDHLDLMTTTKKSIRQNESHAYWRLLVDDLREICLRESIHITTATQGTRESSKKAMLTEVDVGESYGKVQSSDIVISINQTPEEYAANRLRLAILKNRDYIRGKEIEMYTNMDMMVLCDLIYAQKNGWV